MQTQTCVLDRLKAAGLSVAIYFASTAGLLLTLGMIPTRFIPLQLQGLFPIVFIIVPFIVAWKILRRGFGSEARWSNAVGGMAAGLGGAFPISFALVGAHAMIPAGTLGIIGCWTPTIVAMVCASFLATYIERDVSLILFLSAPVLGLSVLTLLLANQ